MILFRILLVIIVVVVFSATDVMAAIYTWTDDSGSVHMVDNEDKVPIEYRDKAIEAKESAPLPEKSKKRKPIIGGPAVRSSSEVSSGADLYGGHTLLWWKGAIAEKKVALERFQDEFDMKKGFVDAVEVAYALRRAYKRVEAAGGLGPSTGVTYKDRRFLKTTTLFSGEQVAMYNKYKAEVEGAEGIIKALSEELEDILREARLNDVPKSVRGQ